MSKIEVVDYDDGFSVVDGDYDMRFTKDGDDWVAIVNGKNFGSLSRVNSDLFEVVPRHHAVRILRVAVDHARSFVVVERRRGEVRYEYAEMTAPRHEPAGSSSYEDAYGIPIEALNDAGEEGYAVVAANYNENGCVRHVLLMREKR